MSDEELEKKAEERQKYLDEHFNKITKENYDEFVEWCIEDVYSQQDDKAKQHIREEKEDEELEDLGRFLFLQHFGPCLTIRNMYLWNRDYSEYGEVDIDGLSHYILESVKERIRNEE